MGTKTQWKNLPCFGRAKSFQYSLLHGIDHYWMCKLCSAVATLNTTQNYDKHNQKSLLFFFLHLKKDRKSSSCWCIAVWRMLQLRSLEGRQGMSDDSLPPPSGISGLSFDSTLISHLLFFCLLPLLFLPRLFSAFWPILKLFLENSSILFAKW